MVEIVHPGKRGAQLEVECQHCECVFRFFPREAQAYHHPDGQGYKLPCPSCGLMVWKHPGKGATAI